MYLPEAVQVRWRAVTDDYYYVRHNELFRTTALLRLGALTAPYARLLLCAEDLGMIPASVPAVLDELQVLSLELERMPKTFTPQAGHDPKPSPRIGSHNLHTRCAFAPWLVA